jgi:amino acid transporter
MESVTIAAPVAAPAGAGPGEKGLKANALGFVSSVVIGVASTAPGYSLAAVLGLIVAVEGVGVHAPAIMLVAFIPMLFVAMAYRYMNRPTPSAGRRSRGSRRRSGRARAGSAAGRSSSPTSS